MPRLKRTAEQIAYDIEKQEKTCCVCSARKPFTEFFNFKNKSDGKSYRCKDCDTEARKKWSDTNPEKAHLSNRGRNLKHKYGVNLEWYEDQFKKQNYSCAICESKTNKTSGDREFWNFSVDHCHDSGKVRGILCNNCNRALGLLQDSAELLQRAKNYLEK
jgi:hypothetical protein